MILFVSCLDLNIDLIIIIIIKVKNEIKIDQIDMNVGKSLKISSQFW